MRLWQCLLVAALIGCIQTSQAQDIHFSQISLNPVLYNPAYTGFFEGAARFGLIYRNQWASVSKPYQTFAATAEASISRNRYMFNGFNVGAIFYRDQAGSLNYGTTAVNLILSYYQSPTGTSDNYVSGSIEVGYGQDGFNAANADLYDPMETFEKDRCSYFTVGLGAAWFYQPSTDVTLRVAFSARNLNRPNISFLGLDSSRLSIKWNLYAQGEWRILQSIGLTPIVAVQLQHQYHEIYYGTEVRWYLYESPNRIVPYAGVMMRHADAAIFTIGTEYNAFQFGFSYDANISKLVAASRSFGALELGLVYRIIPVKKRAASIPCPVF